MIGRVESRALSSKSSPSGQGIVSLEDINLPRLRKMLGQWFACVGNGLGLQAGE